MKRRMFFVLTFPLVISVLFALPSCSTSPKPASAPSATSTTFEDGFKRRTMVETGVPMFNKIPYLNRLFMNTSIGRDGYIWDDHEALYAHIRTCAAAVSPDGRWLLLGKSGGGEVSLFSLTDPKDYRIDLVPSRNDGTLKNVKVEEDGVSYEFVSEQPIGSRVDWLRFTPDGSSFLAYRIRPRETEPDMETMELFDRATGQRIRTLHMGPNFQAGAVSPDGNLFIAVCSNTLEYHDLQSGLKAASILLPEIDRVSDIRCSPDDRFVFLLPQNGSVRVYDARSLIELARIPFETGCPQIDVSPDGRILAVLTGASDEDTSPDVKTRLYEIGSWRLLREIPPPSTTTRYVFDVIRFSPDGRQLLAHGYNRVDITKKLTSTVQMSYGVFTLELNDENSTWGFPKAGPLPLHLDARYLLDGRKNSARHFVWNHALETDFEVKFNGPTSTAPPTSPTK